MRTSRLRNYEDGPSILAVSRNRLATPEPIGLDMDDFAFEESRSVDFDDFAFPVPNAASGMAAWEVEVISDVSSRVSEGQLDDQQFRGEEELEQDDNCDRYSSVVRFEPCSDIFEITVPDDSSLTRCRPIPEDRIYRMIERYSGLESGTLG